MRFVKKIRFNPNKTTLNALNLWFQCCKDVYNAGLEERMELYKRKGLSTNFFEQKKQLVDIKDDNPIYKSVPNKSLTEMLERLDKAYKAFFKGGGFPKFMNVDRLKSIYFVANDVRLKNNSLFLPKLKTPLKLMEDVGEIQGGYKSVRIKKEEDKWFIILNYDTQNTIVYNGEQNSIGCDLGLKTVATFSNGQVVERFSLSLTKKYCNRIAVLQKSLSSKNRGSRSYKKIKKQISKTHSRLRNSRTDYFKKEVNKVVKCKIKDVNVVVVGDLQVKKLMKSTDKDGKPICSKRYLRRSFGRSSVSQFRTLLTNKLQTVGIKVYGVNESLTSKTCSSCGKVNDSLTLVDRTFVCDCGTNICRDLNSSINIKLVWLGQFKPYSLDLFGNKRYRIQKK